MLRALVAQGYRLVKEAPTLSVRTHPELTFEVPCKKGRKWGKRRAHIFAHSAALLGFSGVGSRLRKALLQIPGVKSSQTGDEEFSVTFPPDIFEQVASIVVPMRRRTKAKTPLETAKAGGSGA